MAKVIDRKSLDKIASSVGGLLAVGLLIAGALMTWAYSFTNDQVKTQLLAQQIFLPAAGTGGLTSLPAADQTIVAKDAGEQVVNGRQAEVFADHYIAVHLRGIGKGMTYSQASTASMAAPTDTALAGEVQTLFRGETLRGMLLNAYAFWQIGQIVLIASYVAYLGAVLFLLLTLLGFRHGRRQA